ncbi:MAG: uracil-DNA glycosylase [Pseudomonadota bacterium]
MNTNTPTPVAPDAAAAAADNALRQPLDTLLDGVVNDWQPLLTTWRQSPAGRRLIDWVDAQAAQADAAPVYPADVFRALRLTPLAATRVVILGQDPYHGPGQAEGLAFSVPPGQPLPPSLRNIFKELRRTDPSRRIPTSGHLGSWTQAGVLLLNTSLTVAQGRPGSHAGRGWEVLTDAVIQALAADARPRVFMLWGAHAQSKAAIIEGQGQSAQAVHRVLRCNHPSPLSALRGPHPFIGCGHFQAAAEFLSAQPGQTAPWQWPG